MPFIFSKFNTSVGKQNPFQSCSISTAQQDGLGRPQFPEMLIYQVNRCARLCASTEFRREELVPDACSETSLENQTVSKSYYDGV